MTLLGTKTEVTEEFIVTYNKYINTIPEYHSVEQHNEQIKKYGANNCYLCKEGSKPVLKDMLKGMALE